MGIESVAPSSGIQPGNTVPYIPERRDGVCPGSGGSPSRYAKQWKMGKEIQRKMLANQAGRGRRKRGSAHRSMRGR